MAGLAASLLLKPALDAALAGTAAKGTMDMNKKKEGTPSLGLKIVGDGSKTKAFDTNVRDPQYKTLSQAEKDELMIMLVEDGLSAREAIQIATTGYIGKDTLKKLSPNLRRKLSRMTGQDLEAQLGFGPGDDGDDDDKKKTKKDKIKKLREDAEKEQREWESKETDFQRNDPKVKRRLEANEAWDKAHRDTPSQIDPKDPKHLGNTPEQKMEQGELRMKEAIKNGRGSEWEYQHVTPTSNIPMRR